MGKTDDFLNKMLDEELEKTAKRFTNQDPELIEDKFLELLRALREYDKDLKEALDKLSKYEEISNSNILRFPLLLMSKYPPLPGQYKNGRFMRENKKQEKTQP